MSRLCAVAMLAVACLEVQAAQDSAGSPTGDAAQTRGAAGESKPKILNPMREKEPMSGEMKRDGMMKEDVRKQAMKKDAMMQDAMKKEEIKT
jgi:hypothetical protein